MKKEEFYERLADIDEEYIVKAAQYSAARNPKHKKYLALAACAAVLVLLAVVGFMAVRGKFSRFGEELFGVKKVLAANPDPVAEGMSDDEFWQSGAFTKWYQESEGIVSKSKSLQNGMVAYETNLMREMLGSGDDNAVCSPLNIYLAFSMLAEVTDGNSRAQILEMLGVSDIETLREQAGCLWESNCYDLPIAKSILANSIWLS